MYNITDDNIFDYLGKQQDLEAEIIGVQELAHFDSSNMCHMSFLGTLVAESKQLRNAIDAYYAHSEDIPF